MNSEALARLGRPVHSGATDPDKVDFTVGANPRRPSGVANVYESALSAARRHPADDYVEYRTAAAEHLGCDPRDVIPCSGDYSGIRLVCDLLLEEGDSVLTRTPGCEEYPREAHVHSATPDRVPHDRLLETDPDPYDAVILCHPLVQTGSQYETSDLLTFVDRCREVDVPVVVEETFLDLAGRPTLAGVDGVVAVRSLGEAYGLPGLRMGAVVATGSLREDLDLVRPCWELSVPGAIVGEYCLDQESFLPESRDRIDAERDRVCERLADRFDVVGATGVFVNVEAGAEDSTRIVSELREQGLIVRDGSQHHGLDNNLLLSLRRRDDNDRLLAALDV